MPKTAFLTQQNLEGVFRELGLRARAADKIVEIAVYGGSALVLTLPGRVATKDVDAVIHHDQVWLRDTVAALAEEKGWLSHRDADPEAKYLFKTYPSEDEPGLRVFLASPHYLFAMKCLAMRIGGVDESRDRSVSKPWHDNSATIPPSRHLTSFRNTIRCREFLPRRNMASRRSFPGCRVQAIRSYDEDDK
jgi:hypothetical protein